MTTLPPKVQIGAFAYTIETDKAFADSHNAWAYIQYGKQRIIIDPEALPDRLRVAVMHEVLHGIHEQTGTRGEKWEEAVVTQDAAFLVDTLRRNPALVAYLMADDDAGTT